MPFWKWSGWSCSESCGLYEYLLNQSGRLWYYNRVIKIQGSLTISDVVLLCLLLQTALNLRLIFWYYIFQGHPNPLDGIQAAVKSALTKAYKEQSKSRMVRAADLVTLPGIKKAPKKRIAAILEPNDEAEQVDGDTLDESEEENTSDTEDLGKLYVHFLLLFCL